MKLKLFSALSSLFFIILFVLFAFSSLNPCFAANVLFKDDFSNPNETINKWQIISGNWEIQNETYVNHIMTSGIATATMTKSEAWQDHQLELDTLIEKGVDIGIWFRATDSANRYGLNLRFGEIGDTPNIKLWRTVGGNDVLLTQKTPSQMAPYKLLHNRWYHIKILIQNTYIKVSVDDKLDALNELIIEYTDNNNTLSAGKVGLQGYSGNVGESIIKFDNVIVTDLTPDQEKTPIVLIPGHGASWNLSALTTGTPSGPWKKTPFVNVYDNLKTTFLNAGYVENQDYFEFYYDWRKNINKPSSNDDLVYDLKNYIDNTVLNGKPAGTKVNLIGHSMGGLLARAYSQEYGKDKINQITTVGSPHEGAIKAYNAWEAGEINDKLNWSTVAFQLLLQINKNLFQTNSDAVKTIAPSTQDLLPIFDYLKNNNNGTIIAVDSLSQQNTWLKNLKSSLTGDIKTILHTIYGKENNPNEDTVEWLKVEPPTWLNNLLGQWPDGKPVGQEYTDQGDLTVLAKSASINDASSHPKITGDHVGIIESTIGIQTILQSLGLNTITPLASTVSPAKNPSLVFFLHSPTNIKVIAPDGEIGEGASSPLTRAIYSSADKLIVIPDALVGDYQVQITGTAPGTYHLEIGQLTNAGDQWQTITRNISSGETHNFLINFNPNTPQPNPLKDETGEIFLILAKQKLEKLSQYSNTNIPSAPTRIKIQYSINNIIKRIDKALNYLKNKNYSPAAKEVFYALTDCQQLRIDVNKANKVNTLSSSVQTYINNELADIIFLLSQGWVNLSNKSGSIMPANQVKRQGEASWQAFNLFQKQVPNKQNKVLGAAAVLANQTYEQGSNYFNQTNFNQAYINFVLSRNFTLEASQLLK